MDKKGQVSAMNAMDALLTRRSIRKYADRPVDDELLTRLLKAAMAAPSAGNQQPWHFVIIRERGILDKIPDFHQHAQMCKKAQAAILVCADPSLEKHPGYWVQDCSAATQNILIAAQALGLGAVWCGVHPRDERVAGFRKLLGLPEGIIPMSLIPVGWPAEYKEPSNRFDGTRIHINRW